LPITFFITSYWDSKVCIIVFHELKLAAVKRLPVHFIDIIFILKQGFISFYLYTVFCVFCVAVPAWLYCSVTQRRRWHCQRLENFHNEGMWENSFSLKWRCLWVRNVKWDIFRLNTCGKTYDITSWRYDINAYNAYNCQ